MAWNLADHKPVGIGNRARDVTIRGMEHREMARLDGKIAIITGASRGIGAATARLFAREGARVVLVDKSAEPLQDLARETNGMACVSDVTHEASVMAVVAETIAAFGRIDVAVLNAGIAGERKPLTESSTEMFDRVMAVNVKGVWLGLKHVMRAMDHTGGSIVVMSSASGIRSTPNTSAYTASKHAAVGLMRAAAMEGAAKNIRVNSVNPSTIDTPMVRALAHGADADRNAAMARNIPMGRLGTAEEIASLVLFLASDESSFCTGGVYMADGGVSAGRAR